MAGARTIARHGRRILRLRRDGLSSYEIAADLGCSSGTVLDALRTMGVPSPEAAARALRNDQDAALAEAFSRCRT